MAQSNNLIKFFNLKDEKELEFLLNKYLVSTRINIQSSYISIFCDYDLFIEDGCIRSKSNEEESNNYFCLNLNESYSVSMEVEDKSSLRIQFKSHSAILSFSDELSSLIDDSNNDEQELFFSMIEEASAKVLEAVKAGKSSNLINAIRKTSFFDVNEFAMIKAKELLAPNNLTSFEDIFRTLRSQSTTTFFIEHDGWKLKVTTEKDGRKLLSTCILSCKRNIDGKVFGCDLSFEMRSIDEKIETSLNH